MVGNPGCVYVGALIFSLLRRVLGLNQREEAVLGHETSLKIHADGDNEIVWANGGGTISYNHFIV